VSGLVQLANSRDALGARGQVSPWAPFLSFK
jgi:hypothetical protein